MKTEFEVKQQLKKEELRARKMLEGDYDPEDLNIATRKIIVLKWVLGLAKEQL